MDYSEIAAQIAWGGGGIVELRPASLAILLSGLGAINCLYDWHNAGSELTASEFDDVETWLDGAALDILTTVESDGLMIGSVFAYPSWTIPANCLRCDGAIYDKDDYPELVAVLDANYMYSSTEFRVPDLGDHFIRGASSDGNIGAGGGSNTMVLQIANLPAHSHTINRATSSGTTGRYAPGGNLYGTTDTSEVGSGEAFSLLPPFEILTYVIVALP